MFTATTQSAAVRQGVASLRAMMVFTVLLGLLYPAAVWGVGQVLAPDAAAGSLVRVDETVVGSSLIGQSWSGPEWFHGRPSVSDDAGDVSGGSNLGAGADLDAAVSERRAAGGLGTGTAPADALTASASGLDPDVSPAFAQDQVARVAAARGLPVATVTALVEAATQGRTLGFLGEERVNVLAVNTALAALTR